MQQHQQRHIQPRRNLQYSDPVISLPFPNIVFRNRMLEAEVSSSVRGVLRVGKLVTLEQDFDKVPGREVSTKLIERWA